MQVNTKFTMANTATPNRAWLRPLQPEFREFKREDWQTLEVYEIGGVPVEQATTERFVGAKNDFLEPTALSTADVDFGQISEVEFESLKREFGGLTEVPFERSRDYEATDFLPPVLQALLNQDLELPEPVVLPESANYAYPPMGEDLPIDLTANCHGTAWEAMRSFQGHNETANIFLGDAAAMDGALTSDRFLKVGEAGKNLPDGLHPGDVVAFDEISEWARMTMLLHTAVYVGGGLFFEKPNTESVGEDSPYRLATWEMLTAPVQDYADGKFSAQAYRPVAQLEKAAEMFGSDQLNEWQSIHGPLG